MIRYNLYKTIMGLTYVFTLELKFTVLKKQAGFCFLSSFY